MLYYNISDNIYFYICIYIYVYVYVFFPVAHCCFTPRPCCVHEFTTYHLHPAKSAPMWLLTVLGHLVPATVPNLSGWVLSGPHTKFV